MIDLNNVYIQRGDFEMMNLNITFERGKFYGIIGENGSGKTTLLKAILGINKLKSGEIVCDQLMAYVPDRFPFESSMSIKHYIEILQGSVPNFDYKVFRGYIDPLSINYMGDFLGLSKGMERLVMIYAALSMNRNILILDEVLNNLDLENRDHIIEALQTWMEDENHTLIMTTHLIDNLERVADEIILIKNKGIKLKENPDNIVDRYQLWQGKSEELPSSYIYKEDREYQSIALIDTYEVTGVVTERLPLQKALYYLLRGK